MQRVIEHVQPLGGSGALPSMAGITVAVALAASA